MTEQTPSLDRPEVVRGTTPRYEIFVDATAPEHLQALQSR